MSQIIKKTKSLAGLIKLILKEKSDRKPNGLSKHYRFDFYAD